MSRPNKNQLIDELACDGASMDLRTATLQHGLAIMRQRRRFKRRVRMACQISMIVVFLAVGAVLLSDRTARDHTSNLTVSNPPPSKAEVIKGTNIRVISDQELFSLFEGRPIAMVGPADNPRLVFLDTVNRVADKLQKDE